MRRACLLLLVVGCGPRFEKLETKNVRSLGLRLVDRGETYCPKDLLPELVGVVTYDDGRVVETRTPYNPDGKLRPHDLAWSADVGFVEKNGVLDMPRDLFAWHDRVFAVRATVPGRPELAAEQRITPRFDCPRVADVSGIDGQSWRGEGGDGRPAPRVEVVLAYVETKLHGRLVLVRVRDHELGRWEYHLVDPRAGQRLTISAEGGDGSDGGDGGDGRDGGSGPRGADGQTGGMCQNGQDGAPGSDGDPGGDGGPGGRGGNGAPGGVVTVIYPAAHPELTQVISVSVRGGKGGRGGNGGKGGEGGSGAQGGSGGSAGPTSDPNWPCTTTAGRDGREGRKGPDGRNGADGPAGHEGSPGSVTMRPGNVDELLGFERGRGWAIVP